MFITTKTSWGCFYIIVGNCNWTSQQTRFWNITEQTILCSTIWLFCGNNSLTKGASRFYYLQVEIILSESCWKSPSAYFYRSQVSDWQDITTCRISDIVQWIRKSLRTSENLLADENVDMFRDISQIKRWQRLFLLVKWTTYFYHWYWHRIYQLHYIQKFEKTKEQFDFLLFCNCIYNWIW